MSNNRKKSDSHILELALVVSPTQEKALLVRLDCARQLYNACLEECLRRLKLKKESKQYQKARQLKGNHRTTAFKALSESFEFREYDIHAFAATAKNQCHIKDHLDVNTCQKIATRAFKAVQQYSFGKKNGRPRFKGSGQFDSVEGKSNKQGIVWREDRVVWSGMEFPVRLDPKDKHGVQAWSLGCRTKYVRIVRRKITGKNRFYVQLVLEGLPKVKHAVGNSIVGLDPGTRALAGVTCRDAFLEPLCAELLPAQAKTRRKQRKMDRSLRATNPDAFRKDGTIKPRVRLKKSKSYLRTQSEYAEAKRVEKAHRKSLLGRMANRVLGMGIHINIEKVSYRAWQRTFGKSIGLCSPGMFVSMLRRKAESAGGAVNEFPVSNRLSQVCHGCGSIEKKPLSRRWHDCACGVRAQRDLYSAFLAMNVVGNDLDVV